MDKENTHFIDFKRADIQMFFYFSSTNMNLFSLHSFSYDQVLLNVGFWAVNSANSGMDTLTSLLRPSQQHSDNNNELSTCQSKNMTLKQLQ